MIQSVLLPDENDEESSECLVEVLGSVVQILGFGLFWNTKIWSPQQLIAASVRSTAFSSDDIRTSAGWRGFLLAATGAPSVPFYLLADDWCHSQLNKYSEELLLLASVRRGPATCSHIIAVSADTGVPAERNVVKALYSPVHPNRLRASSAIVTALQQTNDREISIYDL